MDIKMPSIDYALKEFQPNGRVQLFATNEAMRLMNAYVPTMNNVLRSSAVIVDGGTATEYRTPYAHYQYKGQLYVDPITLKGSFFSPTYGHWSRPNVDKILDPKGRTLKYTNPHATSEWDKTMMRERGEAYIKSIQAFIDKG